MRGYVSLVRLAAAVFAAVLLWAPSAGSAQTFDLTGVWDTTAIVQAGPNTGENFLGWLAFDRGGPDLAGTFQAVVAGVSIGGSFSGQQSAGWIHGTGITTSPRKYDLVVDATITSDGAAFHGTWSDSDGRSGEYRGVRRAETLPQAGSPPWVLLVAAWVLLAAAFFARRTRGQLA